MTNNTDTPVLTAEMADIAEDYCATGADKKVRRALLAIASGAHVVVPAAELEQLREMALQRTAAVIVYRGQALAASEPVAAAFESVAAQHDELLAGLNQCQRILNTASDDRGWTGQLDDIEAVVDAAIAKVTTP